MIDALHISESGLRATQKWIDAISNNVANMQTAGFKKSSVHFSNLVRGGRPNDGTTTANPVAVGGAGIGTTMVSAAVFSGGSLQPTHNPLDVAIQGTGFLEVIRDDGGMAYTRVGRLKVNSEGQLVNIDGLALSDDIRIPPDVDAIEIQADGTVRGHVSETKEVMDLGQIRVARISAPEAMAELGNGLYAATEDSGDVSLHSPGSDGVGSLLQEHLELSNVDLVEEMTSLVVAQRAYQLNARIIQTADQVMETINNLRR